MPKSNCRYFAAISKYISLILFIDQNFTAFFHWSISTIRQHWSREGPEAEQAKTWCLSSLTRTCVTNGPYKLANTKTWCYNTLVEFCITWWGSIPAYTILAKLHAMSVSWYGLINFNNVSCESESNVNREQWFMQERSQFAIIWYDLIAYFTNL